MDFGGGLHIPWIGVIVGIACLVAIIVLMGRR